MSVERFAGDQHVGRAGGSHLDCAHRGAGSDFEIGFHYRQRGRSDPTQAGYVAVQAAIALGHKSQSTACQRKPEFVAPNTRTFYAAATLVEAGV